MKAEDSNAALGQKTAVVMALTMISRIGGFVRDVILAQIFGASAAFDAFVIAFKIPNLMRRLFGEGAFAQALIPVLTHYRTQQSAANTQVFINKLTGFFGVIALAVVIIGEILAPVIVMVFAPGFMHNPARFHLAIKLVRITQPYLFSMCLVALAGAILNTYHRFALTAFTPVILNVVLIGVAYFWIPVETSPESKVILLAWGVLIAGVLQLLLQWPALQKLGLLPSLRWERSRREPIMHVLDPAIKACAGLDPVSALVKTVCKRIAPALLGVSVAQISLLLDNLFASFLPPGSISWLYYSDRLIYLPLGVIGVALSTVVTPHLAHQYQQGLESRFAATLDWGMRCVMVIAIPAAAGLFILAGPILATLVHHGAFTATDVWMTRRSLMAFALGLPAWMIIKILAAAFYSRQNIQLPAKIAVVALVINLIGNFILLRPLAHAGLALATTLASWFNAVLLWIFLMKKNVIQPQPGWWRIAFGVSFATALMACFLWWQAPALPVWLEWGIGSGSRHLLLLIGLGIMIYLAGLWLTGLRWRHFR